MNKEHSLSLLESRQSGKKRSHSKLSLPHPTHFKCEDSLMTELSDLTKGNFRLTKPYQRSSQGIALPHFTAAFQLKDAGQDCPYKDFFQG